MNRFRNPSSTRYTKSLFFETTLEDKSTVVYTLKNEDHLGYPSLYKLYKLHTLVDPTEYTFALSCLDGWEHWEMLQECTWFKPYIATWRRELEVAYKAKALKAILDIAQDPEAKERLSANKFLLSWQRETGKRPRAGRPSKDEIKQAAFDLAQDQTDLDKELQRVRGFN